MAKIESSNPAVLRGSARAETPAPKAEVKDASTPANTGNPFIGGDLLGAQEFYANLELRHQVSEEKQAVSMRSGVMLSYHNAQKKVIDNLKG